MEVVEVTVDPGASKSVWPMTRKGVVRTQLKKNIRLAAANGTSLAVKGEAELRSQGPSGKQCSMKFLDADVKKPLASVSSIVDQGNRVVFDADASYVENIESGRRIPMVRRRGVFVMEIEAGGPGRVGGRHKHAGMEVDGVERAKDREEAEEEDGIWFRGRLNEDSMEGFRRQA